MTPLSDKNNPESRLDADDQLDERPVSLAPLFQTLWLYRQALAAGVLGLTLLAMLGAFALSILKPSQTVGTFRFRLIFDGAEKGTYPNGTPFSAADIVSGAVLNDVFEKNGLEKFGRYEDFKPTVFILQANDALELLTLEYQAKLSEARLTAADRAGLEDEFRRHRDSLREPQFSLNIRRPERFSKMPRELVEKVLSDILDTWATQANQRRGALKYNIPTFSRNVLPTAFISSEDYIVGIDIIRSKVERIRRSIAQIAALPGAELVRVGKERVSLAEVRATLEDIVRFKLQPLVGFIRSTGLSKDSRVLGLYFENQLFQIKLDRQQAASHVQRLQESLREYVLQRGSLAINEGRPGGGSGSGMPQAGGTPAMIPQFGESFLDRLVELSTQNNDVQYRQDLTDRIIQESLAVTTLDKEQAYYEDLNRSLKGQSATASTGAARQAAIEAMTKRFNAAVDEVLTSVDQVGAIYDEISKRNLNPSTLLYAKTRPFSMSTTRAVTMWTIALVTLLAFLLSLVLVPVACLIHHYFLREVIGRLRPTGRPSAA